MNDKRPSSPKLQPEVSERRERRRKLEAERAEWRRTVFEDAPEPMLITDDAGIYVDANRAACRLFGIPKEELIGRRVGDFADTGSDVRAAWGGFLERRVSMGEARLRRPDGTACEIQFSSTADFFPGRHLTVLRDITESKRAEEELRRAQRLESVGMLAGGLAHDFNNILTAILGNISLARMYAEAGGRLLERLEEAERASLRARELTQRLLTFARGGEPLKKTASIMEIFKEAMILAVSSRELTCEFRAPEDLWPVEVDGGQMSQVAHNLARNAQQAMRPGGVLRVEAENVELSGGEGLPLAPGRYVRLAVRDEGEGIAPENLPKIFDPFFTTRAGGTGLGLATAYSIVNKHGGHLAAESRPGRGTTIWLWLPASPNAAPAPAAPPAPRPGRGRVLVMDDEESVRRLAGDILRHFGYEPVFAESGEEALAIFERARLTGETYDAVILDLTVPGGLGGKEIIGALRELAPRVRAIVSSGYSNDPVMARYAAHGFDGVLAKPYQPGDLGALLDRLLGD